MAFSLCASAPRGSENQQEVMSLVAHSLHASTQTRLVRTKLQIEGRAREFALLKLAMASFAAVTSLCVEGVPGVWYT